jgi:predicted metal-dependent hydrolase
MKSFVQLALDWWVPAAQTSSISQPVATHTLTQDAQLHLATETAHFSHQRANRFIRLGVGSADYRLTRSRRKTIGMSVGPEGLDVRAPRWVSLGAIEEALHEKAAWILRKLQESQERQKHMQSTVIEWRDGICLPYLGETVRLHLDAAHFFSETGACLEAAAPDTEGQVTRLLKVAVSQNASPSQIRDAVQAWLMGQAKQLFIHRLNHFAPVLGVQWRKLSLSNASTRWGSAGSDGSIRLNWRLVHFKPEIIDYVVVHELSHLRVMDHSPLFWETVRTVVPDYASRRAQLREETLPQWA